MTNEKRYPWLVLACLSLLSASSIGICINSAGVFYQTVAADLNVLVGTFTLHATASTICLALTGLVVPRIMSEKTWKPMILIGALMAGISTALMGSCNAVWQFIVLGSLRGIGSTLYAPVAFTVIVNNWFLKNRGIATSIVFSFSGVAGAIFSPVFTAIIGSAGWRTAYVVMGVMIFVLCLPALFFRFTISPATMGKKALGAELWGDAPELPKNLQEKEAGSIMGLPLFFIAALGFVISMITMMPQHFAGYAGSHGFDAATGGLMLSAGMIGNIVFKLLLGVLADRIGEIRASLSAMTINVAGILILMVCPGRIAVLGAAFLYGAVYSVAAVGVTLMCARLFPGKAYGKAYPIVNLGGCFSSAVIVSVIDYIYDFTGSYMGALALMLFFDVLCLLFILKIASLIRAGKK